MAISSSESESLLWGLIAAGAMVFALVITYRKIRQQDRARCSRRLSAESLTLNGVKSRESMAVPTARDLLREVLFLYQAKLDGGRIEVVLGEGLEHIRVSARPRSFAALLSDLISLSLESVERVEARWVKIQIIELEHSLQVVIADSSSMSFTVCYPKISTLEDTEALPAPSKKVAFR